MTIHMMNNLRRMDLNLLLTLHVLLEERHVSRAAQRLHKSQPAVSHALAQLRSLFNDPLLVRRGGRFELTSRAVELYQPLVGMLEQLDALMGEPSFDPAGAQRTFRLAMSDYGAQVLLPGLVGTLRQQAPGVRLQISQASRTSMLEGVNDGELDMALGYFRVWPKISHACRRYSPSALPALRMLPPCLKVAEWICGTGCSDLIFWWPCARGWRVKSIRHLGAGD